MDGVQWPRTTLDEATMDPGFKREMQRRIGPLVWRTRVEFPHERPESIADKVEPLLNYGFPSNMPTAEQERGRREIRDLIIKECSG